MAEGRMMTMLWKGKNKNSKRKIVVLVEAES